MKFSLQTFLLVLTMIAIVGFASHNAFRSVPITFRQYLNSIEGSDAWFRIGSYTIEHSGREIVFDLYYADSDKRPDWPLKSYSYPNTFGLYCIWQLPDASWRHKEVAGVARTTFHKIASVKSDKIELQLRPNFQISAEDWIENMKNGYDINKPYSCMLKFERGIPLLLSLIHI